MYPNKIICLTEESVETLYALGLDHKIVGVSQFVERPKEAKNIQKVSSFIKSDYKKIEQLKPDLILGFSDIQANIAKDLISKGYNVWISNHRSIDEIKTYILTLGSMLGEQNKSIEYLNTIQEKIQFISQNSQSLKYKPKVYFEEWDSPMISAIEWVSEIINLAGGKNIFEENSKSKMAKDRIVNVSDVNEKNPDIILACWCGKKFKKSSLIKRFDKKINAIKNDKIYELDPAIFLQPGPAPLIEGIEILYNIFKKYNN